MTVPPEVDGLVARVLAESTPPRTATSALIDRAARNRRRRHTRAALYSAVAAVVVIGAIASVAAIQRPDQRHLRVVEEPTTTTTHPGPAVQVLRVTCGPHRAISVDSPRVEARPDGVHLHIDLPPKHGRDFSYETFNSPDNAGSGSSSVGIAGSGPWTTVEPLAPGKNILWCDGTSADAVPNATIEVVDPHHYWTPISLPHCTLDHIGPTQVAARPVDAVRNWLATVGHADASVISLGYPRATVRYFGVREGGKLVGRVPTVPSSNGQWQLFGGVACRGFAQRLTTLPR